MKRVTLVLAAVVVACVRPQQVSADILFATEVTNNKIVRVDTSTNTVTTVLTTTPAGPAGGPDSLIFDTSGNIIYSQVMNNQVRIFNPKTLTDSQLAAGFAQPRDLTLEPGGASILVSDFIGGAIDRVNLTTHAVSTLASGASPDGTTYDNAGNLFAVVNRSFLVQLSPTTGALIKFIALPTNQADGLTFDPVTGALWVADENFPLGGVIEVPTSLSGATEFPGGGGGFDGVESNGQGLLFLAQFFGAPSGGQIYQFDVNTHTFTGLTLVPGLDDLAPLIGNGAPPVAVPEPSSLGVFGSGVVGLFGYAWRRRKRAGDVGPPGPAAGVPAAVPADRT
jgi:sugar lactone lactonase YvrE